MLSAGMEVEVFARPDRYPEAVGDLGAPYRGLSQEVSGRVIRCVKYFERRLGTFWQFAVEPYIVTRIGCRLAVKRQCNVVYITDVDPWIMLILCMELSLRGFPLPIAGLTPGYYAAYLTAKRIRTRIRFGLNYYAVRWLTRYMDVAGTNKYVLANLHIEHDKHAHVTPEGHENHIGLFTKADARNKLKLPMDRRIVLLFGVGSREKGANILLQALESVPPNFMVCIVGKTGGIYEDSWGSTERLQKLGWTDQLHIVPRYVSEDEMQNYYAACDAVVIPYWRGFYGASTHLRRASEHGKAIIACDQYHIGKRVREYDLGLTFETENPESLAASLRIFMDKPESWFDHIRINSQRVLTDESWEKVGIIYRNLFESMLASRQKPTPAGI